MDRKKFAQSLLGLGICPFVASRLGAVENSNPLTAEEVTNNDTTEKPTFTQNWISDLLDAMEKNLPRDMQVKIIEGCGWGCYNRHQFKKDIAIQGSGNLEKLIEAYRKNFEIWKEGELIHIRYGETSSNCYCPVVKNVPVRTNDIHCECTKATHRSVFEAALGRPVNVTVAESLRRGGKTCHFVVEV